MSLFLNVIFVFVRATVANTQLLEEQVNSGKLQNELLEKRVEQLNDVHSGCDGISVSFHLII